MFPGMAKWQPYLFGLGMCGFALFMMGAGTLGVPRRHWDMSFAGNALGYEFPGTAWLMMSLMAICGLAAIVGGAMYLLITVGSVFLGKKIETPGLRATSGRRTASRRRRSRWPWRSPSHGSNIGTAGFVAPGTFALAMVFLIAFMLYYFVNWKYLSTVWPLS